LEKLGQNLDDEILKVVDAFYHLKGRIIIFGLGKSGHVARKAAATLSSTGSPATFVHASEALHGDLGMITADDVAVFISKSGENPELNLILPTLKRMSVELIAITCNAESSLSRLSDHTIHLGDVEEICPLDLAPTTSATLCMVILDAIAMELMEMRKFNKENYAMFHPGGRLGRRLLFQVSDLRSSYEQTPKVTSKYKVSEVLNEITKGKMGAVLVVDDQDNLLGLITDNDIRRHLQDEKNFFEMEVTSLMNSSPKTCGDSDNAYETLVRMREFRSPITLMPVVNKDGKALGILRLETMVQQGLV
jgi:arabinose-5-phosphate isomerase